MIIFDQLCISFEERPLGSYISKNIFTWVEKDDKEKLTKCLQWNGNGVEILQECLRLLRAQQKWLQNVHKNEAFLQDVLKNHIIENMATWIQRDDSEELTKALACVNLENKAPLLQALREDMKWAKARDRNESFLDKIVY